MTTELEKQFFSVFGIEPKIKDLTPAQILYSDIERLEYPQILDKQYLELICVLNDKAPVSKSVSILKETILKQLIRLVSDDCLWITDGAKEDYKQQVQAIFEGER